MVAYQKKTAEIDDLSGLSPEEKTELEELANEPAEKDSISFEEFKKNMSEWLSKL